MKKLINESHQAVREALEGYVDLSPSLALLEGENIVVRATIPPTDQRKVALISGGGSGHEPAHAGYVGEGMLTAAVAGDIFTSPSVDAIVAATLAVAGPAGVLYIVKNYTGDRLNFSLAAEIARREGIPAELVFVADDASLRDLVAPQRRRGIAGTVLVHKIAGAAAEAGKNLTEVTRLAKAAAADVVTMGVGLGSCTVPSAGKPSFELGRDELEFGLGIHGEKGVRRDKMQSADAIVEVILDTLLNDMNERQGSERPELALLVNGLGATPPMELSIVARHALRTLRSSGWTVSRAWVGNFMTALEMPGCSLSLLPLDPQRKTLLDAASKATAWPGQGVVAGARKVVASNAATNIEAPVSALAGPITDLMRAVVTEVADALEGAETELTDLDSRAGDGDLGASMKRGAQALRALPEAAYNHPEALLLSMANSLRRTIAGSSGPFYAAALMRAGRMLSGQVEPDASGWGTAFTDAAVSVSEIGGAKVGDRTMYDALAAAVDGWNGAISEGSTGLAAWEAATRSARDAAAGTAAMKPGLGRASYLGDRAVGVPDGGAVAVAVWMEAIARALKKAA